MIRAFKLIQLSLIAVIALLLVSLLGACDTTEPTRTPLSNLSPSASATYTPVPATSTPGPDVGDGAVDIILPSPTLAPTITPNVISELVHEYIEDKGLQKRTFIGISVDSWLDLGVSILVILVVGFLLSRLITTGLMKVVARTNNKYALNFLNKIRSLIFVFMVVISFQLGTIRLALLDALVKQWLRQLYIVVYVVIATVILWHLLDALIEWYQNEVEPKKDQHQVDTLLLLLHRGARVLLVSISAIMLLSLYNINVNALIAALGVGGLALSLAAQDTLSNVISGIMIMLDQPFRVGDRIEIQGLSTWGDVVDIGLRSTRIRTRDNRLVIIPNNNISTDQIVNYTYPDPRYRIQIEIGIGYGQDIEKVRQLLVDTVRQVAGVLPNRPVEALYIDMGESAMTFRVRWWIHSYGDTRHMFDRVNTALQKALDEAEIKTPFNTLDINILNIPDDKLPSQLVDEDSPGKETDGLQQIK